MARDVEADVNINDKSARGLRSFIANLRNADKNADKLQRGLDKTTDSTSKLGSGLDRNAKALSRLARETDLAKNELAGLARAFAETDDAAQRIDLTKAMKKQQAEIRKLGKNSDILKELLPDPGEIVGLGTKLSQGIGGAVAKSGPYVTAALVGAAVAAAPVMGATIVAGIFTGAAGAAVVGGLVIAAKDQRVQSAFKQSVSGLKAELQNAAVPFVSETLKGINILRDAADTINFDQILGDASKFVVPLAKGVASAVESIGNGIEKLVAGAEPVVDALSQGFADLGDAVGDIFTDLADNGVDAAAALTAAFKIVEGTIRVVGAVINGLTEAYGFLAKLGVFGQDAAREYIRIEANAKLAAEAAKNGTPAFGGFQAAIESSGEAARTSAQNLSDLASANRDLYGATTSAAEAIATANSAIRENGAGLSLATEKGRENRQSLENLAGALSRAYEKQVAVNGLTGETVAFGEQSRAAFIKAATAAGAGAAEANRLADSIVGIPKYKATDINVNSEAAQRKVDSYIARLRAIPAYKRTVIETAMIVTGNTNASAVAASLRKQNSTMSASGYFAAESATSRTGGPVSAAPVINAYVSVDNSPSRAMVRMEIEDNNRRQEWRASRKEL